MKNPNIVSTLIVAAAFCIPAGPLEAAMTQTLGTGSAVTVVDRFDNFDYLDYTHNGTPLSNYPQPPLPSTGLTVQTNGNSFYGEDFYGRIQPTMAYFNPFHLTGTTPVGYSYYPAGGGFYFPYDGDFGNTDWVTISTTDSKTIYGVEFLYGNGWTTGAISGPFPWGSDTAVVEWKTFRGGALVSSGTVNPVSVGTVLGFSDPAGFDQLMVRCPHPNSVDPTLQELALDNLVVQLSPICNWTGTSNSSWADSGNWIGAVAGATSGTTNTDTATFNQNAPNSPLLIDAGRNVKNIIFDTADVNSVTIGTTGGQPLLLTAGGAIQATSTVVSAQTVNAPLTLQGDYAFKSDAGSSFATLSFGGQIRPAATSGVTSLTLTGSNIGANTISGVLADNASGKLAVTKAGAGLWVLAGANAYSGDTTVLAGTLKFDLTAGTPTVSAGATVTVASDATLELAGSVSALGIAGGNRLHLVNDSTAAGVVISGTHQVVGGIDGVGNVEVGDGSDLTADHIVQNALIIGGIAGGSSLVTIAASDASGYPLDQSLPPPSGSLLADSLSPGERFGVDFGSFNMTVSATTYGPRGEFISSAIAGAGSPAIPEPSGMLLAGMAAVIFIAIASARRRTSSP